MAIRRAMIGTTTMSSMGVKPFSFRLRRRSISFCSMLMGLLVMAMDDRARVPRLSGTPGHHDRRSPPGSPAGLLVTVDEDRPRGVAPPPSSGFAFVRALAH